MEPPTSKAFTHHSSQLRLFALALALCGWAGLASACSPPAPAALIAFLDCSASFQPQREAAVTWLKKAQASMEPRQDQITVFRLSDEVLWLYGSQKHGPKLFAAALTGYLEVTPGALGTALGEGLVRGVDEAVAAQGQGLRPQVVVLSDGEAEGGRQGANLDEKATTKAFERFPKEAHLHLLFLHPKPADRLRRLLLPLLGPRLHLHTEEACRQGLALQSFDESRRKPRP